MPSRRVTLIALSAPALGLMLAASFPLRADPPRMFVIVTQKDSTLSDLSSRELKRLYKSERVSGPDGKALIPLNHPSTSPARVAFDALVLEMSPDEVGRYWVDRKIRGQTGAPKAVPSLDLLRRAVASVAGTVTYLDAADVTSDLKPVTVDGKRPTDAGYPLRVQ